MDWGAQPARLASALVSRFVQMLNVFFDQKPKFTHDYSFDVIQLLAVIQKRMSRLRPELESLNFVNDE